MKGCGYVAGLAAFFSIHSTRFVSDRY